MRDMNRDKRIRSAYQKLLDAIRTNECQPEPIQAAEVLGASGDWLPKLTTNELLELQAQITMQLRIIHDED